VLKVWLGSAMGILKFYLHSVSCPPFFSLIDAVFPRPLNKQTNTTTKHSPRFCSEILEDKASSTFADQIKRKKVQKPLHLGTISHIIYPNMFGIKQIVPLHSYLPHSSFTQPIIFSFSKEQLYSVIIKYLIERET
jgi:hypothetical protein